MLEARLPWIVPNWHADISIQRTEGETVEEQIFTTTVHQCSLQSIVAQLSAYIMAEAMHGFRGLA